VLDDTPYKSNGTNAVWTDWVTEQVMKQRQSQST
jgi:hypothetical protein